MSVGGDSHRSVAARNRRVGNVVEIRNRAMSANHIFRTRKFDKPRTKIAVVPTNALDDTGHGDVVSAHERRIQLDLNLLFKSSDGSDIGNTGNGPQPRPDRVVLIRPQIGERSLTGRVDKRVLKNPSDAGCVGTE